MRDYPAWCDRCGQPYLAIPGIDGCPWHQTAMRTNDIRLHRYVNPRKPGTKWSVYCACGGPKGSGAKMCKHCRAKMLSTQPLSDQNPVKSAA